MNPEIKEQWLEALPKYEQTQGALRLGNGFCCLGVLCDISKKGEWDGNDYVINNLSEAGTLPLPVSDWAEILENDRNRIDLSFYDRDDDLVSLAMANDAGCTFQQIADLIRYFL